MTASVPRHALTFLAQSGKYALKCGIKKGLGKAAAKANPATMVFEAAISVIEAVDSFYTLKEAQAKLDGYKRFVPLEEERLRKERLLLKSRLEVMEKEIQQTREVQARLGDLAQQCASMCFAAFDDLQRIRASDLPDLKAFDDKLEVLEDAWQGFRRALANYYDYA